VSSFPHPSYRFHVLLPSFELSRAHLFLPLIRANQAHVTMLADQKIISEAKRAALLRGLDQIEREGVEALKLEPGVEDLFFAMEKRLIELTGSDIGGDLQLARSRNDLGAALHRMVTRSELIRLIEALDTLRAAVLSLAEKHVETLMPGYTHTQPAQPTTFAHYLAGVLAALERDAVRLRAAYQTTNQSPLGMAAFTTTSFPIDRSSLQTLLGFDDLLPNGQDAIGAGDYAAETAAALQTIGGHLSRVAHDLLFLATQEAAGIRIDDSFIQISSIMPQKRNPVVLEHLRARIAQIYGGANAVATLMHSSPYGDTQDVEDELMMPLLQLTDVSWGVIDLFTAVFATLEVNREHLRARADAGFTTATELADTLVREKGLAFRTAHHIVATVVKTAVAAKRESSSITVDDVEAAAQAVLGHKLELSEALVRDALDPQRFIERRTILGGPAPATMRTSLAKVQATLADDQAWLQERKAQLASAESSLQARISLS
jgi:argininosuccinate lyase